MQVDWGGDTSWWVDEEKPEKSEQKKTHRRKTECKELSLKYEYKRAHSEVALIDCLGMADFKDGYSYNFITSGDVDALSYLKLMLRHQPKLHHLIASTWCISAEDILQLKTWVTDGTIKEMDMYVGEIFPGSYRVEWEMLQSMYQELKCGRLCFFRNHSKIFAGVGEKYAFGIQLSANFNTNPRTENGCITIDKGLYDFYKAYFDGIKSF